MGESRHLGRRLLAGAVLLTCWVGAASGATPAAPDERRALFQQVLADPGNPDLAVRYAEASVAAGDVEGAIASLERALILQPNLANVQLQLGLLYYRIGSYPAARRYLAAAKANPALPPESRPVVDRYLADSERNLRRNRFEGVATAGIRFQSNENSGPESLFVRRSEAPGGTDIVPGAFREKSDFDALALGTLVHSYDLETQSGATIETRATAYVSEKFQRSQFDTEAFSLSPGVRFKPAPGGVPGLSLRPHVSGEVVRYDQELYNTAYGGGIDGRYELRPDLTLDFYADTVFRNFNNVPGITDSRERDGVQAYTGGTATLTLDANQAVQLALFLDRINSRAGQFAYFEGGVGTVYLRQFGAPWRLTSFPWQFGVNLGLAYASYDSPDQSIDRETVRQDTTLQLGASQVIGLTEHIGALLQVDYRKVWSSLSNYEYDDFSTLVGLRFSF